MISTCCVCFIANKTSLEHTEFVAERAVDVRLLVNGKVVASPIGVDRNVVFRPTGTKINEIKEHMSRPIPTYRNFDGTPITSHPNDFEGTITGLLDLPPNTHVYWRCWQGIGNSFFIERNGSVNRYNPWFIASVWIEFNESGKKEVTGQEIEQIRKFYDDNLDSIHCAIIDACEDRFAENPT